MVVNIKLAQKLLVIFETLAAVIWGVIPYSLVDRGTGYIFLQILFRFPYVVLKYKLSIKTV